MSKLGQSIVRSIEGGKNSEQGRETKSDDAFKEAGLPDSAAETNRDLEDLNLDFVDDASPSGHEGEKPEPIPVAVPAAKKTKQPKSGGGKVLSGSALTVSLLALMASGYVGFKQVTGDVDVRQSIVDIKESLTNLTSHNEKMAGDLADTQSVVQVNGSRVATLEQFGSDIQMMRTRINDIQGELGGIKSGLESQQKILDEHRLDIDNVDKQVKTLRERPAPRTIVKHVQVPAPQPQAAPTLEGATVASIDMWGSQPYVVLRDSDGGWVPLQTGDYYQGWRLQGAVGNEAVFKSGSKTRRMAVE